MATLIPTLDEILNAIPWRTTVREESRGDFQPVGVKKKSRPKRGLWTVWINGELHMESDDREKIDAAAAVAMQDRRNWGVWVRKNPGHNA